MAIIAFLVSGYVWCLFGITLWILYNLEKALRDPLRDVPGPLSARFTRLWYFHRILRGQFERDNIALHQEYGQIVRLGPNFYSIDDADSAKIIYGHGSNFAKAPWYKAWMPPDPNKASLFADTDSDHHAHQRRKFASAYSMSSLVGYEPFVNNCTSLFERRLHDFATAGSEIDLAHWFQCFAFDVIGEITFGRRFGFLEGETDGKYVFDAIEARNVYSTFIGILPPVLHKTMFPLLPTTGGHGYVGKYTMEQIGTRENLLKSPEVKERDGKPDFVSRFFQIREQDPEKMSKMDIFTMCQSNIGAGSDTTAISLSAIVYNLLKHPETYARLQNEIHEASTQGRLSEAITFKEAQSLPYLQAVIKESLRLHSATGLPLARVVPEGGAILAGKHFPAGTIVGINSWVAHRNTDVFGADSGVWRPERWLEDYGSSTNMEHYFLAFGMGSRTCIGKNLSLLEMSKLIPQVLRTFDFILDEELSHTEWKTKSRWFVKPQNFSVKVIRRK